MLRRDFSTPFFLAEALCVVFLHSLRRFLSYYRYKRQRLKCISIPAIFQSLNVVMLTHHSIS